MYGNILRINFQEITIHPKTYLLINTHTPTSESTSSTTRVGFFISHHLPSKNLSQL